MHNLKERRLKGFSLIELSIAILVISLIATFALSTLVSTTKTIAEENNIARMQEIYKAMTNFLANNKRLPCPSTLVNVKGDSSYGVEAATPGTCTGLEVASNVVYGMVPFRTLGISEDTAEDIYGTRFSYVVDRRFTLASVSTSSITGFEVIKAMPSVDVPSEVINLVVIQSPTGTNFMTNSLFAIIGHGANKSNGWSATSAVQNPSVTSDEASNAGRSTNTTGIVHNTTFIASSTQSGFDDILLFKNKYQLVVDAGLDKIMCSGNEATPPAGDCEDYYWVFDQLSLIRNGLYRLPKPSLPKGDPGTCCVRVCGSYGVWEPLDPVEMLCVDPTID